MSPPASTRQSGTGPTVLLVRCVECGHVKEADERGWVTVLSPSGSRRIHYCSPCIEDLVGRASAADEVDDYAGDE
jgi:hypothetical protein